MPHTEQHTFYIVALYNRLTDEFYGYSTGQRNGTAKTIPRAKQYKTKKSRRIQSITILSKDKNYPSNRQLYVRTMLIAEIKDFLQKGFLTWRYKANVLVNPDNSDYHPIAVDYTFNPPFYQLFDYSLSIHNLLQTPEIINTTEVTRCIWQEKNYKKYNLSLLTLPQAKDIIKRNEMLITKLNSILIQNKLIEQINAVPTT